MRTLKRTLCLVLVLAMVLSLGVTNVFAATNFTDDAAIEYDEAAAVMNAIGVIRGRPDGSFDPAATITRAEACAIIVRLIDPEAENRTFASYFDDTANHWAKSAIGFCEAMGFISGDGDGKFRPDDTITGTEFAKLLLEALGYDAETEGLQNNQYWDFNIDRLARSNSLVAGITGLTLSNNLTREKASQMGLNTLKATLVYYDTNNKLQNEPADPGSTSGQYKDYRVKYDDDSTNKDPYMQLCEKYFPDLKLVDTAAAGEDEFKRENEYKWTYGTGADSDVFEVPEAATFIYTDKVKTTDIAKALHGYKLVTSGNSATMVYENGGDDSRVAKGLTNNAAINKNDTLATTMAAKIAALTGNGKVVEIYTDSSKNITSIVIIKYGVGEVSVVTDVKGDVTYSIGGVSKKITADTEDVDEVVLGGTVADGDVVTYVNPTGGKLYLYPTTEFSGKQTSNSTNDGVVTVTIDGAKKTVGDVTNVSSFTANSEKEENFYLDQYGYLVYRRAIEENVDTVSNYAVILKIAAITGGLNDDQFKANLLLSDGTVKDDVTVVVNKTAGSGFTTTELDKDNMKGYDDSTSAGFRGQIVTYKVNDNGTYTLTKVAKGSDSNSGKVEAVSGGTTKNVAVTKTGEPKFTAASAVGNVGNVATDDAFPSSGATIEMATNRTVYLVATGDDPNLDLIKTQTKTSNSDTYNVYTGYANVPSISTDKTAKDSSDTAVGSVASVSYAKDDTGAVVLVFIDIAGGNGFGGTASNDVHYFYVPDTTKIETEGTGDNTVDVVEGFIDGEEGSVKSLATNETFTHISKSEVYTFKYDAKRNVSNWTAHTPLQITLVDEGAVYTRNGDSTVDAVKWAHSSDFTVYYIDATGTGAATFSVGKLSDVKVGAKAYIISKLDLGLAKATDTDAAYIGAIYVFKADADFDGTYATLPDATSGYIVRYATSGSDATAGNISVVTSKSGSSNILTVTIKAADVKKASGGWVTLNMNGVLKNDIMSVTGTNVSGNVLTVNWPATGSPTKFPDSTIKVYSADKTKSTTYTVKIVIENP